MGFRDYDRHYGQVSWRSNFGNIGAGIADKGIQERLNVSITIRTYLLFVVLVILKYT